MTTKSNTNLKSKPFLLSPAAKDYLWGGRRLNDEFSKDINITPLAETWECSTHPDGESIAKSGEFAGKRLSEILKANPQFLGSHPLENMEDGEIELPIMIKFIDANKDLSVQVHPSDEYARKKENGQRGKTEMWYVLDAAKNAYIYYGLQFPLSKSKIEEKIAEGSLEKYLQKVPVKRDDVYFVEAGCIHAIGAGVLVAEIQENSNLTYRIYDYDRIDKNGNKRELHIGKALEVSDLTPSPRPKQSMRVLRYKKGCAIELLNRCKYFEVHRLLINTERTRECVEFCSDEKSFRVLLCTAGCGVMITEDSEYINFFKGDCIFVPASSMEIKIHGRCQMLDVRG